MKIGFDAKRFYNNYTGLGNYSRYLINTFNELYPQEELFLFTPNLKKDFEYYKEKFNTIVPHKNNFFWRFSGIKKEETFKKLDIYHGLSNEIPIGISKTNVKSILTVHDIIFIVLPNLYPLIDRNIYKFKLTNSLKESSKVLAISNKTKKDLINILNVEEHKIEVIYQSCNDLFKSKKSLEELKIIKKKYNLPQDYILNVGTIEKRKNILQLIKASKEIDYPVVIVGKKTEYFKEIYEFISSNNLNNKIITIENVNTEDLAGIYQSAKIFVYPSIYEGFGIPIIEAFYSKIPVITSSIEIFKEVAEDAALQVSPYNFEELSDAIKKILNNDEIKNNLIINSEKRLKLFDNKTIADQIFNLYTSII